MNISFKTWVGRTAHSNHEERIYVNGFDDKKKRFFQADELTSKMTLVGATPEETKLINKGAKKLFGKSALVFIEAFNKLRREENEQISKKVMSATHEPRRQPKPVRIETQEFKPVYQNTRVLNYDRPPLIEKQEFKSLFAKTRQNT